MLQVETVKQNLGDTKRRLGTQSHHLLQQVRTGCPELHTSNGMLLSSTQKCCSPRDFVDTLWIRQGRRLL